MLVTTLATEAMIGLGQIPHPMTGNVHAEPAQARYAIDMLEMLAEKTKGNLAPGEERGCAICCTNCGWRSWRPEVPRRDAGVCRGVRIALPAPDAAADASVACRNKFNHPCPASGMASILCRLARQRLASPNQVTTDG